MTDCKKVSLFPVPMEKVEKLVGKAEDEEPGGEGDKPKFFC